MSAVAVYFLAAVPILTDRVPFSPRTSADVVTIKLSQGSIGDGLERYGVEMKIADGWHVVTRRDKNKPLADAVPAVRFEIDGQRAGVFDTDYPEPQAAKTIDEGTVRTCSGVVRFYSWLAYDDTKDAKVITVLVRVKATTGIKTLAEATVRAEFRQ